MQKQVALISRLAGQDGADLAEHLISFFHTKSHVEHSFEDQFAGEARPGSHGELGGHDGCCSI